MKTTTDFSYEPHEFAERDAIHVAVYPCIASVPLKRGERVTLVDGVAKPAEGDYGRGIGVANPFVSDDIIEAGDRFWLFLYPESVTSIRHHWTHPDIEIKDQHNESEKWLRWFASDIGLEYEDMMTIVRRWCGGGRGWVEMGDEQARSEYKKLREPFWEHVGMVTGLLRPDSQWGEPFDCSC